MKLFLKKIIKKYRDMSVEMKARLGMQWEI